MQSKTNKSISVFIEDLSRQAETVEKFTKKK